MFVFSTKNPTNNPGLPKIYEPKDEVKDEFKDEFKGELSSARVGSVCQKSVGMVRWRVD